MSDVAEKKQYRLSREQFARALDHVRRADVQQQLLLAKPTLLKAAQIVQEALGFPINAKQLQSVLKVAKFEYKPPRKSPSRNPESDTLARKSYGELLFILFHFRDALLGLHDKLGLHVDRSLLAACALSERLWGRYHDLVSAGKAQFPLPDFHAAPAVKPSPAAAAPAAA